MQNRVGEFRGKLITQARLAESVEVSARPICEPKGVDCVSLTFDKDGVPWCSAYKIACCMRNPYETCDFQITHKLAALERLRSRRIAPHL